MPEQEPAPAAGVDMARAALAAARAAAKTKPAVAPKKPRRRVTRNGTGRDPIGLAAAITGMMAERGWEAPAAGGSIVDQWPAIAPELAPHVHAVRFDHETGTLHLRPASPAYATQLRLFQSQLVRRINEKTGSRTVRRIRVLAAGEISAVGPAVPEQPTVETAAEQAPVRTRETACAEYREALEAAVSHRPQQPPRPPGVDAALQRQEAALRAQREPETAHRDALWAEAEQQPTGPAPGSVEESLRAAIAYKRRQAAGLELRRVFDVA